MNVNDYVVANNDDYYTITNTKCLCKVVKISYDKMDILVVGGIPAMSHYFGNTFTVDIYNFHKIHDIKEFLLSHSNFHVDKRFVETIEEKKEIEMELKNFVLSNEQKRILVKEFCNVLDHYLWHYNVNVINKIIDIWFENKKERMFPFTKNPKWDKNKFMLIEKNNYVRCIDVNTVYKFRDWVYSEIRNTFNKTMYLGVFDFNEINNIHDNLSTALKLFDKYNYKIKFNGWNYSNVPEIQKRMKKIEEALSDGDYREFNEEGYNRQNFSYYYLNLLITFMENEEEEFTPYLTEEQANKIKELAGKYGCEIRARKGEKIMKSFKRVMDFCKISTLEGYNSWLAKIGDAINPAKYEKYTIVSFNPVDYLRMSMGDSWESCHTIDKADVDKRDGDNYQGMHANGTMSYMLDPSSVVFYTVSPEYDGKDFELQDKCSRQMYHLGTKDNTVFVQGRLYPQCNDTGSNGLYAQIRNYMQKLLSEVWEIDNLWKTRKPKSSCNENLIIEGEDKTNYSDYFNFAEQCKISYANGNGQIESDYEAIEIGHVGICIECGCDNDSDGELSCCSDFDGKRCYECGEVSNDSEMHCIDGEWYCENCCFYCEYHGEWETGEKHWSDYDNGYICDYAYNEYYEHCSECGELYRIDEMIYISGNYYCSEDCAENNYVNINGYWYDKDECYFCSECNSFVLESDYNFEENCCNNCCENRQN